MPLPLILGPLISAGSSLLGAWLNKRQQDKAAGIEVDMSREALALEKELFERAEAYQREQDTENQRRYDQEYARDETRYQTSQRRLDQDRADSAPYRALGGSALGRLAYGMGLPDPGMARELPLPADGRPTYADGSREGTPVQPWNPTTMGPIPQTGGSLAALGNVSGGGMTTIRTPTGQTVLVPAAKVPEALSMGGTRV